MHHVGWWSPFHNPMRLSSNDWLNTNTYNTVQGLSVAEWLSCRTRNPVVPGSSPALATC